MNVQVSPKASVVFKHQGRVCRIVKEVIPLVNDKITQWDIKIKEGNQLILADKVVKNWNNHYQLESRSREFKSLVEVATFYTSNEP